MYIYGSLNCVLNKHITHCRKSFWPHGESVCKTVSTYESGELLKIKWNSVFMSSAKQPL